MSDLAGYSDINHHNRDRRVVSFDSFRLISPAVSCKHTHTHTHTHTKQWRSPEKQTSDGFDIRSILRNSCGFEDLSCLKLYFTLTCITPVF